MRWIIVSNRLPFSLSEGGDIKPSSGGLVTALSGVHSSAPRIWLGIAPPGMTPEVWQAQPDELRSAYTPVFVPDEAYEKYYNGIANDVFWPLFHYEGARIKFDPDNWRAFQAVNQRIAEAIGEIAEPGDYVWVHDFHLFLLPQYLRERDLGVRIGFFLHIPFPSSELFRQLPVRAELLKGLLGADLIGFHDYAYLRHFCNALLTILDLDSNMLHLHWQSREIRLGVFPVSIDVAHFMQVAAGEKTAACLSRYRESRGDTSLILGVDRLDYTKGLLLKLGMFKSLLESHPELQGQVSLLQIAIPTRQDVEEYQKLRAEFERMVGEINGAFSRPDYTPVQYMYSSVSFEELLALYRLADVLLVTSTRDGMNLVALEYIVSQPLEKPGMVVLSEFTGAASMLSSVLTINPWDACGSAEQIYAALHMPIDQRRSRMRTMQEFLSGYSASDWAQAFMEELTVADQEKPKRKRQIEIHPADSAFMQPFLQELSGPLLLFLDYDGTLVPIESEPSLAIMPDSTRALLAQLCEKPGLELVVISGRDAEFLTRQFAGLPLNLAAEHGAKLFERHRQEWVSLIWTPIESWYPSAEKIMQDYTRRVPNSLIERKEFSIAWHYRQAPAKFGRYQAVKLKEELEAGLSNLPASVLSGSMVVEARAIEAHKGYFIRNFLESWQSEQADAKIMAIGDDVTDEDMMEALPEGSLTIKVGAAQSWARYRLQRQQQVLELLQALAAQA